MTTVTMEILVSDGLCTFWCFEQHLQIWLVISAYLFAKYWVVAGKKVRQLGKAFVRPVQCHGSNDA